jgi:hypothetical protein
VVRIVIPLIAVIFVGGAIYANYATDQPVQNFHTLLLVQVVDAKTGQTSVVHPRHNVGVPGGIMNTTEFISEGIKGNYPVHTEDTSSGIIYIESRVSRAYTLGDFFQVWGETLGVNNTLGQPANYTGRGAPFVWDMCILEPGQSSATATTDWGTHVLKDRETIDLLYSQTGCA